MNTRQLRYFREVVEAGTLARASERLFVAPTAISMQIAQLEQQLGGTLFDRTVKPMTLTSLGKFFLPRAKEWLAEGDRLRQETVDLAKGKSGWLGIGFVRSLIFSLIPTAVRALRVHHPDVQIELVELLSEYQHEQLRNERIHLGISRLTHDVTAPPDMRHTVLFDDPFVVAVPAAHPLARRKKADLAKLADLPFVSYPKDPRDSYAPFVLSTLHAAGARPRVGHEAIEIHTALGLVAAGLGYALVGASVAERGVNDVTFLHIPEIKASTTIVAATRADEDSALVASMLAVLRGFPPPRSAASGRRAEERPKNRER